MNIASVRWETAERTALRITFSDAGHLPMVVALAQPNDPSSAGHAPARDAIADWLQTGHSIQEPN